MHGSRLGKGIGIVAVGLLLAAALAPTEEVLRRSDQQKLAKGISAYYEALDESKGINEAFVKISDLVDKTEKRMKEGSALALTDDWEQAFFLARLDSLEQTLRAKKGRVSEVEASLPGGATLTFAMHVPQSYNPKKEAYPLILIVPDEGKGSEALLEEAWADADVRESALLAATNMPADTAHWGELNAPDGLGGIATVMSTFGQVLGQFAVDMNRVYLVGHGAGATAAAATAAAYPHLFAGLVTVGEVPPVDATNFLNLPSLCIGGGEGATALAKSIEELGYDNNTGLGEGGDAAIFAWTKEHVRVAYPEHIVFSPTTAYTTTAHWLKVEGVDVEAGPRVDARADRASNTIKIDAQKITTVSVFFSDRLVDLDQPVKVVINGVESEQVVARNKRMMLDLQYNSGDWGRIFTNRMSFDVPVEEAQ